jgi:(R,R)-butanediol dehydrogenase/meso-butanediol dehydrogenase/diacetyl reductase
MRAAVYHGRLDVRVEDVPEPTGQEGHALVAVSRCALCGTDASEYAKGPTLLPAGRPTVLGHEFVGTVVGGSTRVPVGTRVVSGAGVSCGSCRRCRQGRTNLCLSYSTLGLTRDGGLAELVSVPERTLQVVPDDLPDELAVLAQPLAVGLHAVRRAAPAPGDTVVLLGAGAIGTFVLLGLLDREVGRILVADVSADALATLRALGDVETCLADDVADAVRDTTDGLGADLVIEASGSRGSLATAVGLAARGGRVQAVGLPAGAQELDVTRMVLAEVDVLTSVAHVCDEDLPEALRVLAARRPALRTVEVPLEDVVEHGLVALAERRAEGKVVVSVG